MAGDVKMDKWWVQTLITVGIILVSMSIAWATYSTRLATLEENVASRVVQGQSDHDLLIMLNTKMDSMGKDLGEVKRDVKKHLEGDK